jgi:hypothetical protein
MKASVIESVFSMTAPVAMLLAVLSSEPSAQEHDGRQLPAHLSNHLLYGSCRRCFLAKYFSLCFSPLLGDLGISAVVRQDDHR